MNLPPIPVDNSLIQAPPPKPGAKPTSLIGIITDPWILWFQELIVWLQRMPQRLATVNLSGQGAAILSTPIATGTLQATVMRVTYYLRITRAATVSSSLQIVLSWLDGTVACTFTGAAITANVTSATQTGTVTMRIDPASAVTYSTNYASAGATTMQYSIWVVAESMA